METEKRLFRSTDDLMIAGVCGGLADYFNLDSSIVRLVFVLFTLAGGSGLLIYLVLWLIIPKHSDAKANQKQVQKEEAANISSPLTKDKKNIIGLILLFWGSIILWNQIMPINFSFEWIWPGILIATGIYLIFR